MIDSGQPPRIEGRRDPEAARRPSRRAVFPPRSIRVGLPKRFELCGCRAARAHQLHLVEHPLGVLVQEGELHRPDRPGRGVAAHQSTAQQHVLRAHEHRRALRRLEPAVGVHPAHEHVHIVRPREQPRPVGFGRQPAEPLLDHLGRLLDERPHGQAPDQSAGCPLGTPQPVRGPSERHRGRLSRSGRRNQDPRPRIGGEGQLPRVGVPVVSERDAIEGGAVQAIHRAAVPRRGQFYCNGAG